MALTTLLLGIPSRIFTRSCEKGLPNSIPNGKRGLPLEVVHNFGSFVVRAADWTNDISSQGNFVVPVPDWLHLESVQILFTMIFVDKSQYL